MGVCRDWCCPCPSYLWGYNWRDKNHSCVLPQSKTNGHHSSPTSPSSAWGLFNWQEIVFMIFFIKEEGRSRCTWFLPVGQLLQEWIQCSKGWARRWSRDAGWVGMGLTSRRQAGNKGMWEWTHGLFLRRFCVKRKK